MADQTPIWKKEIKLRKRSPKPAHDPVGAEPHGGSSIWKKEFRIRRATPKSRPTGAAADLLVEEPVESDVTESEQLVLEDPPAPPAFWQHADKAGIEESFEASIPTEQFEQLDSDHAEASAPAPTWSPDHGIAEAQEQQAGPDAHDAETGDDTESFASFADEAQIAEQQSDDHQPSPGYGWPRDEQQAAAEPTSEPDEIPAWPGRWAFEAEPAPDGGEDVDRENAQEKTVGTPEWPAPAAWPGAVDQQFNPGPSLPTWHGDSPNEGPLGEALLPAAGLADDQEVERVPVADQPYDAFVASVAGGEGTAGEEETATGYDMPLDRDEAASGFEPEAQPVGEPTWTLVSGEDGLAEPEGHVEPEGIELEDAVATTAWVAAGDQLEPESPAPVWSDNPSGESSPVEALPLAAAFAAAHEVEPTPVQLPGETDTTSVASEPFEPATAATAEPAAGDEPKSKSSKKDRSTQIVGVRIGSSQIMVSVVRNAHGVAELSQLASAPVDRGVVVAGEVREPDALAAELKSVFTKHKLPRKGIRLGIASNRVGVRTLEVPAIDDQKALENAIRFRAQDVLSIPLSDVVLDHVVLGEVETPEGRMLRVLLVFAHREIVDRYVEAFKKAKLKLASVDFEAFALLRAVCQPEGGEESDRATVALSIGQERTIFAIAEGRQCDFTRVLEWGGGSLTVALARALDMTPSQAEPIKRTLAFTGDADNGELSAAQLESARAAARNELQVLARELLASLHFYQARPGSLAIGEILVTGGGLALQGAADELQGLLGVPVRPVDPFENVRTGKKAKISNDPGATAIAIGLGMDA